MLQTTDELAAQVPGIKAEIEALKAGVPTDKADALSAVEQKVLGFESELNLLRTTVADLGESFSQLDARLTGRVNDIEARVTQQANYLTEFAGKTSDRLHRLEVATFTGNAPREPGRTPDQPGAMVVGGEPSSETVGEQSNTTN